MKAEIRLQSRILSVRNGHAFVRQLRIPGRKHWFCTIDENMLSKVLISGDLWEIYKNIMKYLKISEN